MALNLLMVTAQIVTAYVSRNEIEVPDVSRLIVDVHSTISALIGTVPAIAATAGAIEGKEGKMVSDDYLVCLEDGAKVRVLKRYLRRFGLTPEEYRRKWNLPDDYPMTAPAYSRLRRRLAKQIGLGTKAMRAGAAT